MQAQAALDGVLCRVWPEPNSILTLVYSPQASDKTFEQKLKAQHLGKHDSFLKPQSKTDRDAHFAVGHYAGTNCIKTGLPGKLILSKRGGLREVLFS